MKNIVIVITMLLIIVAVAYPQAKPGGIARQLALGGSSFGTGLVLNPFLIDDPAYMLLNPAYQSLYKNYGWSNIGGGRLTGSSVEDDGYGMQYSGIAFSINPDLTLGTVLSFDHNTFGTNYSSLISLNMKRTGQIIPEISNTWELVGSYHLDQMEVGFSVLYGWSNDDFESTEKDISPNPYGSGDTTTLLSSSGEASSSILGFRVGVLYDLGEGSMFDVAGMVRITNATDKLSSSPATDSTTGEYTLQAMEYRLNARAKFKISEKFDIVPFGMWFLATAEPEEETKPFNDSIPPFTSSLREDAFVLGLGGDYRAQGLLIAGGLSWFYGKVKYEYHNSFWNHYADYDEYIQSSGSVTECSYSLPVFNLGMEWWFTEWLAGRMGYYRTLASNQSKMDYTNLFAYRSPEGAYYGYYTETGHREANSTNPNSIVGIGAYSSDNLVTLGLGFKFGDFALDATISDQTLRRGLGLIGSSDALNTFGYLTASYNFNE